MAGCWRVRVVGVVAAAVTAWAAVAVATAAVGGSAAAQQGVDCHAGLVVGPGQRCTYPGTSQEFWVDDSGRGHFIFFTAGTGIDARGTTFNGVTYNFKASRQADGSWLIEAAGTTTATTPTTTTTPATTTPATTTTTTTVPAAVVVSGGYADVAGSTHEAHIGALAADGVFDRTGCGDNRFCPDDALARWTMAVWTVRALDGGEPPAAASTRFPDVDASMWWAAHVERFAELRVTHGYGDGTFRPHQDVTRDQMAAFLTRAFDLPPAGDAGFSDTEGNTHHDDINALAASGITHGYGDGTFGPDRPTTRAQMAAFLNRALTADPAEANRPPRFTSPATLTTPENSTAADTVTAVDDDTADTVTGYAITGGADRSRLSITNGGRLSFNTAPDYEHPADTDRNNTYQIIVTATSGTGTRATTATQAITITITEPPSAPAPDLVVATPTVDDSAPAAGARFTLNTTVHNQGNGPSSPTTLRYYRSTDATITAADTPAGTDSVSRLDASATSAESTSVTSPSTAGTYYYGACVDTASDESDTTNNCSPAVTVTVAAESGGVPAAPANVRAAWNATTVVLVWDAVPGAANYRIYHDHFWSSKCIISSGRATWCDELESRVTDTRYVHTSPSWGSNYYWVVACSSAGCSTIDKDNPTQLDDSSRGIGNVPVAPTNVRAAWEGATVNLDWDTVPGADSYKIFHHDSFSSRRGCEISFGSLSRCDELVPSVTDTRYVHTSPDMDDNYYWVIACNDSGCSTIDSDNPAQPDDTGKTVGAPAAPANVRAAWDAGTVVLVWDAAPRADHYKVYHDDFSSSSCSVWSGRATFCDELASSVTGTRYVHSSPDLDDNYYWVVACNDSGCSTIDSDNPAVSNAATGMARVVPIVRTIAGGTSSSLRLNIYCRERYGTCRGSVIHYELSRSVTDIGNFQVVDSNVARGHYIDSGLEPETTYYYMARACDSSECSQFSSHVGAITEAEGEVDIPSTPQGLGGERVDISFRSDDASIWWNPVPGATYYQIYQAGIDHIVFNSQHLDGTVFAPKTSYYDGDPNHILFVGFATTYYRVSACNKAGCSALSESVVVS